MSAVFHVTHSAPNKTGCGSETPQTLGSAGIVVSASKVATIHCARKDAGRAFISNRLPIETVCDRIARDFERGIGIRSLGATYQCCVGVVEEVLRVRLRELEASQRRQNVVAMPSPMRRAA